MSTNFCTAEVKPVACCNIPANLVRTVTGQDRGYDQCLVCGRKHYGMKADLSDILSKVSPASMQRRRIVAGDTSNPLLTTVVDVYTR